MIGIPGSGRRWLGRRTWCIFVCAVAQAGILGCNNMAPMFGMPRVKRTVQVLFYSPDGAMVHVRRTGHAGLEIYPTDMVGHRLEYDPELFAVYDLAPGTYEFAYAGVNAMQGVAIYGQLEIQNPRGRLAKRLLAHALIPIRLLSTEEQEVEQLHPSRDISYTAGLEQLEFEHVKQGDMISKVYFVADLERLKWEYEIGYFVKINDLDRASAVLADREAYLNVRYEDARRRALNRNPAMNVEDKIAHERFDIWGIEEEFIKVSEKRVELLEEKERMVLERQRLQDERARRSALLRSLRIIHREGALVLATPDLQFPFADPVAQASELGEVVAVVTVGGRHKYWANRGERIVPNLPPELDRESHPR